LTKSNQANMPSWNLLTRSICVQPLC